MRVGDKVTYTNDYGVRFTGKTITAIEVFPLDGIWPGQTRYYFAPDDAYWFPVPGSSLTLETA